MSIKFRHNENDHPECGKPNYTNLNSAKHQKIVSPINRGQVDD